MEKYELIMPENAMKDDRVAAFADCAGIRMSRTESNRLAIRVSGEYVYRFRELLENLGISYDFVERMEFSKRSYYRPGLGVMEAAPDAVSSSSLRSILSSGESNDEIVEKIRALVGQEVTFPALS